MTATRHAPLTLLPAPGLHGSLRVPGDKSLSHRYALLGAMARGCTTVRGLSPGADVRSTLECLRALGVRIDTVGPDAVRLDGRGPDAFRAPAATLDAGNSGTTMRLLSGVLAGCPFRTVLAGDASLSRRPMRRVIDPLVAMGARIEAVDGHAPLAIDGGALHGIRWVSPVASAQIKSAVLLAGLRASGTTSVEEPLASRDHTERAFPAFGLVLERGDRVCSVAGGQQAVAPAEPLDVPGDPSSAAVWAAAAAALPGSEVHIQGVGLNPLRTGFLDALARMGARVTLDVQEERAGELVGAITVSHGAHEALTLGAADIPALIDELPVLAARAALGGRLEVSGAGELRVKESDRIHALVAGFRTLGVEAEERPDGFVVDGTRRPTGGRVDACLDHRLVMAFALVALGATGPTTIDGADVVAVSYPGFDRDLARLTGC
ncbi:MAG: 3-phosphoshikimate 1-carboxyvinyltransferase [Vicinamibacterales bacterium]